MFRSTVLFFLLYLCPLAASAQVNARLIQTSHVADSLIVEFHLGTGVDSLEVPISSFQFEVVADSTLTFEGIALDYTLAGASGWTARSNPANGRVGGFSSSADAINRSGVLVLLRFVVSDGCGEGQIELTNLSFNSSNPQPIPQKPSLALATCPQ